MRGARVCVRGAWIGVRVVRRCEGCIGARGYEGYKGKCEWYGGCEGM